MPLDACSDPTPPARPATRSAARVLARSTALLLLIGCGLAYPRVVTDKDTPPEWRTKSQHARLPPVVVDPALPDYKPVKGLAGTIHSVGSSGLSNLLLRWSDEFKNIYPQVTIAIEAVGSDKAVAALVDGQAEIAPMSRAMSPAEIAKLEARFGYPPTRVPVALDAIAVYVNKYNPLQEIDMDRLEAVFAANRKNGGAPIRTWGQLGLGGEWAERAIVPKTPDSKQGLYALFREMVLEGGDFRYDLNPDPVSTSIVQGVGADAAAIGFASRFYATVRTRAIAVRARGGTQAYLPTPENCQRGVYPLSRKLYLYFNHKPGTPAAPLVNELVSFVCSRPGQETVANLNNLPLSAALASSECLARLH